MKVDKIYSDLELMKKLVKNEKPNSIEFNCEKCGKLVERKSWEKFLERKNLLCHSCLMKEVNNREDLKLKMGKSRTLSNRKKRKSEERIKWIKENEFNKKGLSVIKTFLDNNDELNYEFKCDICGAIGIWNEYQRNSNIGISQHPYCKNCFKSMRSIPEEEIYNFIKEFYPGNIIKNDRKIIKPKELDLFLPEINIAIEYNGYHWHKGNNYNLLEKYKLCKEKNIKLISLFEDDWLLYNEKTKEIIKSIIINNNVDLDKISFIKNNIRYIDLRFPFIIPKDELFLGITNPQKIYFFDKKRVNTPVDINDFVYNCGYACYSIDNKIYDFENFEKIEIKEPKIYEIKTKEDLSELQPFDKVKFICPRCKKEKIYYASTLYQRDEFICGNCSQSIKTLGKKKIHKK